MCVAVFFLKDRDLKSEVKKRNIQLQSDYPEILSKILLYSNAGLSIKSSIERIVRQYEDEKKKNSKKYNYAYEELKMATVKMKSGVSEINAINQYGDCLLYTSDPGHGGDDPGKVGVNGTKEKDVNLAISKCLKKVLEDNGFDVVMTRNKDEILNEGGKFSKVGDLNKRCSIINNTYQINSNSIMISIHQNSFTNPNVKGAQSFFYEKSEKSKKLGLILQNHLNKKINTEKEKAAKPNNSYYMLINSKCPGTIIEMCIRDRIRKA